MRVHHQVPTARRIMRLPILKSQSTPKTQATQICQSNGNEGVFEKQDRKRNKCKEPCSIEDLRINVVAQKKHWRSTQPCAEEGHETQAQKLLPSTLPTCEVANNICKIPVLVRTCGNIRLLDRKYLDEIGGVRSAFVLSSCNRSFNCLPTRDDFAFYTP